MKICDNGIIRDMTASEMKAHEQICVQAQTQTEAAEARAIIKANALAKLGLTEAEIFALFGN